jgi:hypothetical protein
MFDAVKPVGAGKPVSAGRPASFRRPVNPIIRHRRLLACLVLLLLVGVSAIVLAVNYASDERFSIQSDSILYNNSVAIVDVTVTDTGARSGIAYCTLIMPGTREKEITTSVLNRNQSVSYKVRMLPDHDAPPEPEGFTASCIPKPRA